MNSADAIAINRQYYETHATDFGRRTAHARMEHIYTPFLQELSAGSHILDAGCGTGRDGLVFQERGYRVTGIDASPAMVNASRRAGLNAEVQSFHEMTSQGEFDGIWACASLLHVPHDEIPSTIAHFARALRPRAVLFVSLKEGCGESNSPDGRFFSYFQLEEFERLLTDQRKFEIIRVWKTRGDDSSGVEWMWLNFLARRAASSS